MEEQSHGWDKIWSSRNIVREMSTLKAHPVLPYILKYTSRKGPCIEAGCGLGRVVFYLSDFGIDIKGIDISRYTLEECKKWAVENGYDPERFRHADVRVIPYPDNYFSTYISLGVIEHFREGPHEALKEAYRVLKPGGIALIEVPNKYCVATMLGKFKNNIKMNFSKLIGKKRKEVPFFQYEFNLNELENFVAKAGFKIIEKKYLNLKYSIFLAFKLVFKKIPVLKDQLNKYEILQKIQEYLLGFLDRYEKSLFSKFGASSFVIVQKYSDTPNCFSCGKGFANNSDYKIPICDLCKSEYEVLNKFIDTDPEYCEKSFRASRYDGEMSGRTCGFCRKSYVQNKYFKDYGLTKDVCPHCMKRPAVSLELVSNLKYEFLDYGL